MYPMHQLWLSKVLKDLVSSQLHQLRGRVGRGADQSYCILMTGFELSKRIQKRMQTMVESNDGFTIAEVDLKLRGPGDLMGTQQSGLLDLKISDLRKDGQIVILAREAARKLIQEDPKFELEKHRRIKKHIDKNYFGQARLGKNCIKKGRRSALCLLSVKNYSFSASNDSNACWDPTIIFLEFSYTRTCRNKMSNNHILLQAKQMVFFSRNRRFVKNLRCFLE